MAGMNINAGAQGNPLDELLQRNGGNLYGNLGGLLYGHYNTTTNGGLDEGGNKTPVPDGMVTENDSRYQQAMRDLGGRTQLRNTNIGGPGGVRDPSQVSYDPRYGLVTDPKNMNPVGETFLDKYGPWLLMAPAAAGIGLGAASGAGMGASYGDSIAALAGGGGGAAGAGAGAEAGAAGSLPDSYWSQLASSGQIGTDATVDGAAEGAAGGSGLSVGGLDPETQAGMGGMSVTQDGIGPGSLSDIAQGTLNNPGSLVDRLGAAASNSPLQTARLGMGLYALGSAGHTGSTNTSGGSSTGSMTDPASIIEQMAQANRVNQTTPFGARTWSQDPTTGRWSVADTMNPQEQANYQNVAGMNGDLTNFARQRLAALMSAPASQRADRAISFRLHGG